jgi:pyruvate ferredoxin oxidoreductase gamma subunit
MIEVRVHGRGGQGAVTTGQILATAAFFDGKESQTFPMFGVERSGAPVSAFCRISDEKINLRSQVYNPDVVIVLDASLVDAVDVSDGLKKDGTIIINSNRNAKEFKIRGEFEIHTVDATSVAMEIFKRPIVNTAMLGAFAAVTKSVSMGSLEKAIDEIILRKKGAELAEMNKKVIRKVCEQSR